MFETVSAKHFIIVVYVVNVIIIIIIITSDTAKNKLYTI